ncbi:hypothetical protein [uncultured Enterobacter sp.]|uniref:hypothetical protein n=1 Tax=uncultured Enterobacter sp. TaxID=238202 RepID=UPI002597A93D|nr:hypothetical protein [uncultured Enterobacter sp.]
MELIEQYQPEFVLRFDARETRCDCPTCKDADDAWPHSSVKFKNQQRDSLDIRCEMAAHEMLLSPDAFVLHEAKIAASAEEALSGWSETLNQQCINLAIHPALSLEVSLYGIGVLLSKAQHYRDNGELSPALLEEMGAQLSLLAEQGVLTQQFTMLPPINEHRIATLKEMGTMRLDLNLPMVDKIGVALKLSELSVMQPTRLTDRLHELEAAWGEATILHDNPYIMRNLIIYSLYHDVFPGVDCASYGQAFLDLARQVFQFKMLCAFRAEQKALAQEDIAPLVSALRDWHLKNAAGETQNTPDYSLLYGLSLL